MKNLLSTAAISILTASAWITPSLAVPTPRSEAVPYTHAHNDYKHSYPFY
ncbi:MAG: hypothetical protein QNJ68_11030 [Microcoleaceae cyanobacterium MO_207.B10]|nr:hypothetical protein [Microcoleaceae cyanobacterium MO_207.B10]